MSYFGDILDCLRWPSLQPILP